MKRGISDSGLPDFEFRERIPDFSLKYLAIRPSEFFGTRRKAVLRGEAYAWAPVLGIFVKLREVGVSPYLGFILYLSTLLMFELIEAVRGRFCHAPIPGPTRLTDPNRVLGRENIYWDSLPA